MKTSILAVVASSLAIGFMPETCEVVNVTLKGSSDLVRVNKDDFDADQEKPADQRQYAPIKGNSPAEQSVPSSVRTESTVVPTVPSETTRLVMKDSDKFFIANGMGAKLKGDGIEETGYKSEKAALDAIAKLPE